MPAFVLFIRDATTDQAELDTYLDAGPATAAGHALTMRAFYGAIDVLEGPPAEGAVLLEFPSMAEARAWYDSPAYQAVVGHRKAGAAYRVMIFEGV